jgi:hypothetical protein
MILAQTASIQSLGASMQSIFGGIQLFVMVAVKNITMIRLALLDRLYR